MPVQKQQYYNKTLTNRFAHFVLLEKKTVSFQRGAVASEGI